MGKLGEQPVVAKVGLIEIGCEQLAVHGPHLGGGGAMRKARSVVEDGSGVDPLEREVDRAVSGRPGAVARAGGNGDETRRPGP